MHSYVEYDQAEGQIQVSTGSDYRSAILMPLDSAQQKTLELLFSHSQAKNVSPLEALYEYTGSGTGANLQSFFEVEY